MSAVQVNYPHNMFSIQAVSGGATIWLPNPETDSGNNLIATLVNSGRNANAVVTAQKIGRDQDKVELEWKYMNKDEWERILKFFDKNFFFNLTYYSAVFSKRITRVFYVSDRNYAPFAIDSNGDPVAYKNLSVKLVDTGEGA